MNPVSQIVVQAVDATLRQLSERDANACRLLLRSFQTHGLDAHRDTLNRIADILTTANEDDGDVSTMRNHADLLRHIANSKSPMRCASCAASRATGEVDRR